MAFRQHISSGSRGAHAAADHGAILIAIVLLTTLAATLGLQTVTSLDALAPAVATFLFGSAAAVCGLGILVQRFWPHIEISDIAGLLTFVGVAVTLAIEPDQMVRLMTLSEQPD